MTGELSADAVLEFSDHELSEILRLVRARVKGLAPGQTLYLDVPDPDCGAGLYAGERYTYCGSRRRHRSFRAWLDLAEASGLRMSTPRAMAMGRVRLGLQRRGARTELTDARSGERERYGVDSQFFRISKFEEPQIALDHARALERVPLRSGMKLACLGVHRGDELAPWIERCAALGIDDFEFFGIDHCGSALAQARARYPDPRVRWIEADLRDWQSIALPELDVVTSMGTLQSPELDGKNLLPKFLRERAHRHCAVMLALPNVLYVDGELDYGARMRNYSQHELSLVTRDAVYYRRLLNKRGLDVTVHGKYYWFVTGTPWGERGSVSRSSEPCVVRDRSSRPPEA